MTHPINNYYRPLMSNMTFKCTKNTNVNLLYIALDNGESKPATRILLHLSSGHCHLQYWALFQTDYFYQGFIFLCLIGVIIYQSFFDCYPRHEKTCYSG